MKKLIAILILAYMSALPLAHAQETQGNATTATAGSEGAGESKHASKFGSKKSKGKGKGHKSGRKGKKATKSGKK